MSETRTSAATRSTVSGISEDDLSYDPTFQDQGSEEDSDVSFDHKSIDLEQESFEEEEEDLEDILEEDLEDATTALGTMTMNAAPAKEWSNGFVYPYLIYDYVDNRQKKLSIDIHVMCLDDKDFQVKMNSSGTEILLSTKMPIFFTSKDRVSMVDSSLTTNTSKVVAFCI